MRNIATFIAIYQPYNQYDKLLGSKLGKHIRTDNNNLIYANLQKTCVTLTYVVHENFS
jgi:hypothetical protein